MKDDTPFILECPSCGTRYEVPVSIPDGGRKVRCANCSHIWVAQPEDTFRMGEEPLPEETPRQEVVFREGEDAPQEQAPGGQPGADPKPGEDAQSAVDALFGADEAEKAEPGTHEDTVRSDPHAFTAAVAEAEARAENTGEFMPSENDVGFDDDDSSAKASSSEPNSGDDFSLAAASAAEEADASPQDETGGADQDKQADEVAAFYGDLIAQDAAAEKEDTQESPAPPPVAVKRPKPRKGFRTGIAAGWALLLLAAGASVYFAVAQRVEIVRFLPGSAPLYEAAGLPVNVRGLDFRDVAYSWETDGGQVVLEVHGDIVNLTSQPLEVPSLVLGLRDENNTEVYQWEEAVMNAPLGAGDRATFAVRIPTPPKSIKSVQVRFARVR